MNNYYFLDLDGTAFSSRRKLAHLPLERLEPAATGKSGEPNCFSTAQHRALISQLSKNGHIIPVTGRNLESFSRVKIEFQNYAVLNFGAIILNPDGSLNTDWDTIQRPKIHSFASELNNAYRQWHSISDNHQLGLRIQFNSDFDMHLQVVAKSPQGDAKRVTELRNRYEELTDISKWRIHHNDNNLAIMPKCIGKEHAVKHLLEKVYCTEPRTLFGLADSNSDAPFLDLCDFCVIPTDSQLWSGLAQN